MVDITQQSHVLAMLCVAGKGRQSHRAYCAAMNPSLILMCSMHFFKPPHACSCRVLHALMARCFEHDLGRMAAMCNTMQGFLAADHGA
jgi:hypothetical protein